MASDHPFQVLFETLGKAPLAHAEAVNREAYETLHGLLSVPLESSGRCILLKAPRAGFGKTHLLARVQHHLGATHEFIPLQAAFGSQIDASSVIDDTLRRLLRPLPASGGLCVLDLVTRRLFSSALQPLVSSGEVPCQDREGALVALRTRPIETFDFHHPNAVTAHWARENFEVLGQRLAMELSQRCSLPIREVSFWVEVLFRFAATPVDNPARLNALAEVVHTRSVADSVIMERLEALLGMLAQLMRVVLVADDVEGFSTDEKGALRLAAFFGAIRQAVERLDVILSLNQDVWESAFLPRLSGGLADRLSEVVVELPPLTEDEMVALLDSRVPGMGAQILGKVDRVSSGSHARGLIRAAGIAWVRAMAADARVVAPVVVPEVAAAMIAPSLPIVEESPAPQVPSAVEAAIARAAAELPQEFSPVVKPVEVAQPIEIQAAQVSAEVSSPPPFEPVVAVAPVAPPIFQASETPTVFQMPERTPVFQAPEPPPVLDSPVVPTISPSVPAEVVVPQQEPAPPIERVVDPTLAIKFLAESGQLPLPEESWPDPVFSPPAAVTAPVETPPQVPIESPFQVAADAYVAPPPPVPMAAVEAAPAFQQEPVFQSPSPTFVSTPAPDYVPQSGFQTATAPQIEPPAMAFPAAEPLPQVFQPEVSIPVPGPVFAPAEAPVQAVSPQEGGSPEVKVPDTDRVDDLLRQFRERYGRTSL